MVFEGSFQPKPFCDPMTATTLGAGTSAGPVVLWPEDGLPVSRRDPVWSSPDISRSSGQGGPEICSSAGAGVTSSSPLSRRKKARTGGEGDSYDPYDFSDAEEEMPEGESPGFCRLLRVLLPSALVGLCTWGAVMPWGHLGSLVWYHRAPQIKMNFFWKPFVAVIF